LKLPIVATEPLAREASTSPTTGSSLRSQHGDWFGITLAGYPEGHPDNIKPVKDLGRELSEGEKRRVMSDPEGVEHVCSDDDWKIELDYLKAKVDAGGEVILTQLFYDVETFLQFVRDCRAHGINCPILPGIMIIQAYGGFQKMCGFCKTRVPAAVAAAMEERKEDPDAVKAYGIQLSTEICEAILASDLNLKGLHFYTLNLEKSVFAIMANLGILKVVDTDAAPVAEDVGASTAGTNIA